MALEDYKVSNNTVMCWDSDGRLNASIWPGSLKNNKVSAIIPQVENFALIKGLVLDGDGFKQYCKIGNSLYLMNDEVKAAREATRRAAQKADPHTVVWNQVKDYLKAQGFTRGDGYEAPTNKLPDNVTVEGYDQVWDDVGVDRESKSPEFIVYHERNRQLYNLEGLPARYGDPEGLSARYEMFDWFRPWAGSRYIAYPLTQQGFEEFKKD